jgi:hypothetical protein
MRTNILFHTFKFINGNQRSIDVAKIAGMDCTKRLFTIFDKNLPWKLTIQYNQPTQTTTLAPVYGGQGSYSFAVIPTMTQYEYIEIRYDSEKSVKDEIQAINKKINYLIQYTQQEQARIEEDMKRLK